MTTRPGKQPRKRLTVQGSLTTASDLLRGVGQGDAFRDPSLQRRANLVDVFGEMSNMVAGGERADVRTMNFPSLASLQSQAAPLEESVDTTGAGGGFVPQDPQVRVGTERRLGPEDIGQAVASNGEVFKLEKQAAAGWNAMLKAATADGISLNVNGALRSWDTQQRAYESFLRDGTNLSGTKVDNILPPSRSLHVLGLAVDINGASKGSAIHNWLVQNAAQFGFFPISNEAWHWEYRPGGGRTSGGTHPQDDNTIAPPAPDTEPTGGGGGSPETLL